MKNKLWVKILYILTLIIQVGIVIGTFVVEYLTNKKAVLCIMFIIEDTSLKMVFFHKVT